MPSKLQKAIMAVKDQTSISLAKVKTSAPIVHSSSSRLEVAILKATTHDDVPNNDRQIEAILAMVSSNRNHASACARALGRRITRTRNWAVALKCLLLVFRLFQDGDPHFPKEVLSAMKRGYTILNLSSFSAAASASPWDFTAFVRTFALYLDDRLHCFLTGKLVRRLPVSSGLSPDVKPSVLLDKIASWQLLLDRAIATRPTGPARSNRLVKSCLYAVVQESFELYRDISDGLALLLDSFFHLEYDSCRCVYEACVKASRQFEELSAFYEVCKSVGVGGRTSDYPSVVTMSEDLLDTLNDFLKDQSNSKLRPTSSHLLPRSSTSTPTNNHHHRHGTSLEDLIGDPMSSSGFSFDEEYYHSDPGDHGSDPDDDTPGWELALLEDATQQQSTSTSSDVDLFSGSSTMTNQYNPFLQATQSHPYVEPTFRAHPHANATAAVTPDLFGDFQVDLPETILSTDVSTGLAPSDEFAGLTIGGAATQC